MGLKYNTENIAVHDDWGSLVMELGQDKVYRAIAINGKNRLVVDRRPPGCNSYTLTMHREASKYFANNFYINASAQLRVDSNPIHKVPAYLSETKGENTTFISIETIESNRFYSEIQNGSNLVIKLDVDGEETVYRFSLNGSGAALQRAYKLCNHSTGAASDSEYFGGDSFSTSPPSSSKKYYDVINVESNDVLNIRQSPNPKSRKVGKIPPNGKCIIYLNQSSTYKSKVWIKVQYRGISGWVSLKFLEESYSCSAQ